MANEGGSVDDAAEADESAGHGVIGVVGVGSDVLDEDAAAGGFLSGGGANVGVVGNEVGDAGAAGNGFFAGGACNGLFTPVRDVNGVGLDPAAAACAFALGFLRSRLCL